MKNSLLSLFIFCLANCIQAQTNRSVNAFARISLAEKPCTVTGTLTGYDPRVDTFKFCSIIYNHLYKGNQQTFVGEISPAGKFSITFPLNRPQELMFDIGDNMVMFYGVPGTSLDATIDLTTIKARNSLPYEKQLTFSSPITYAGPFAALNKDFTAFRPATYGILPFKEHNKKIDTLDQLPYKSYRLDKMQIMLDSLEAYNNRYNTGSEFRQLMTQYIRYTAAVDLLRYRWLHGNSQKGSARTVITPEYLSFLNDYPVDNEEALITEAYSSFLTEYTNLKRSSGIRIFPKRSDTLAFLKGLPDDEQGLAGQVRDVLPVPSALRTPEQQQVMQSFDNTHRKAFMDFVVTRSVFTISDSVLLPMPASKGKDIICAKLIQANLNSYRIPFDDQELRQLSRHMADKDLLAQVKNENDRLRDIVAGNMPKRTHVRTSLEVSSDRFFDELVKPYKGKVVYIDFWAPWCGPCMGEMPNSKELQRELNGKDVVFLYIGISCTKASWENTIKDKDITGEHYFANENEGKLLSAKFNISGIPHYVLVNKEGKVADGRTLRPSEKNKLIKKIDGLLKK